MCKSKTNDFLLMNDHVNKHHTDSIACTPCGSQDMDEGTSDRLEPNHTPYESDTNNNNVLVNDGIETETDYLGCNDKSDEIIVDCLLNMAECESPVNQDNTNEYIPPHQGTKDIDFESFNPFSNEKSNIYFWQDYICSQEEEICGGFRGIVWRSVFKRRLYYSKQISSLEDARLMFTMTQLTINNTHEQNKIFLDIMQDLLDCSTGFETGVRISIDCQSANEILMESKFGIFRNLPHEEVF